jgi:hypothetical protein
MPTRASRKTDVTKLKADVCPRCDALLDAVTSLHKQDVKPKPDDLTICYYCGAPLAFTEDMTLRPATLAEMHDLADTFLRWAIQKQSH